MTKMKTVRTQLSKVLNQKIGNWRNTSSTISGDDEFPIPVTNCGVKQSFDRLQLFYENDGSHFFLQVSHSKKKQGKYCRII